MATIFWAAIFVAKIQKTCLLVPVPTQRNYVIFFEIGLEIGTLRAHLVTKIQLQRTSNVDKA
jgi:hypothetical protein